MDKSGSGEDKDEQLWQDIYPHETNAMNPEEESTYFQAGPSHRSSQYIRGKGFSRYYPALRNLVPLKRKNKNKINLDTDEAGLWKFFTYSWLTKYMDKAYTKGLDVDDIPNPCPRDTCEFNVHRIETLWQDELIQRGPQSASLNRVSWRFIRTRVIISATLMCLCIILGFLSIAFGMRYLLEYAESPDASNWDGVKWALLLSLAELARVTLYATVWTLNYRTAIRLRTAFQGMLYRKILRVYSFGGKSIGELINLFSNDGQRISDLVIFGPMIVGGPISVLLGIIYVYWILGPWPILGLCTIFVFYPLQYYLSQLGGFLKRKVFTITDGRLTAISEILNSMKFIKLFAWAKIYVNKISEIRRKELSLLQKVSFCNSFSSSLSTSAPVIAGILTILIHIIVEKNITASQAFTVMTLYFKLLRNVLHFTRDGFRSIVDFKYTTLRFKAFPIISYILITMRLYITYLQYGLSNIVEIAIICKRFKSVMLLNESTTHLSRPLDKSQSVCIADGCFAYYRQPDQNVKYKMKKRKSLAFRRNTANPEEIEKDLLNLPQINTNYAEVLFDINFFAPKGSLIGICGPVGCGKTSLLSSILGHLSMTKGKLCREGTCAYVSQQAWLMNATVRENILFGEKFIPRKYYEVVRCCDLGKDIHSFPGGDNTEVGERGINLSGGQKQRLALARALYSNRDIYLLDDPLSAVDAVVAKDIFEECMLKALQSKTVLFVSHQIQFLNQCHEVVVMKEGRLVERGKPLELLCKDSTYKLMLSTLADRSGQQELVKEGNENSPSELKQNGLPKKALERTKTELGLLIREEKTIHGALKSSTFMSYVDACGGIPVFFFLILVMLLNVGTNAFSSWWLHMWINAGSGNGTVILKTDNSTAISDNCSTVWDSDITTVNYSDFTTTDDYNLTTVDDIGFTTIVDSNFTTANVGNLIGIDELKNSSFIMSDANSTVIEDFIINNPHYEFYFNIYICTIAGIFIASFLRGIIFTKVTLRASAFIHQKLVNKMMKTSMQFFETTPIGRIQNLFSRDIDEVETRLPYTLENLIHGLWNIGFSLLFICLAFPLFVIPLVAVCIIYCLVYRKFRVGLRDLKRLDNTTRSPILSNVSATFNGIDSIRAFEKETKFINRFNTSYDLNTTCNYMGSIANRWLALRVDAIAVFIMFSASMLVIMMHGKVPPSLAGLAITYASSLCGVFQYTVRLFTDNEVKLISLERINSYLEYMEEEGGNGPKGVPADTWPELGSIRFKNVELKYRDDLEPSLKGITFHIRSEEKIGIVGRTGAGKSSIVAALFRLVEITKGSIKIDNLDISALELTTLRSRMSIIPQDPVLFSGTIRSNLDPANEFNDEELWAVLEKANLKCRIQMTENKLHHQVGFNGDNLSVGEKQLLCLARALLRKTKILVLDEATSGLDHETETVIQNALFTELKHCTIIIIAHRLETIEECNRVLVMENSQIAEFDEPKNLLERPDSVFSKMMNASRHNGGLA